MIGSIVCRWHKSSLKIEPVPVMFHLADVLADPNEPLRNLINEVQSTYTTQVATPSDAQPTATLQHAVFVAVNYKTVKHSQ